VKKSKLNERSRLVTFERRWFGDHLNLQWQAFSRDRQPWETSFVSVVTLARRIHTPKTTIFGHV
jgi:hypothetical protein